MHVYARRELVLFVFQMIVRVRGSLGTWKLNLSESVKTLQDLKHLISLQYNIPAESQIFSWDIKGSESIGPDGASLESVGIKHGCLLFLNGRLEKYVIEKSYVGEGGNIVTAGVSFQVKSGSGVESDSDKVSDNNLKYDDSNRKDKNSGGIRMSSEIENVAEGKNGSKNTENISDIAYFGDDGENIRAPDPVVKQNLLMDDQYYEDGELADIINDGQVIFIRIRYYHYEIF